MVADDFFFVLGLGLLFVLWLFGIFDYLLR